MKFGENNNQDLMRQIEDLQKQVNDLKTTLSESEDKFRRLTDSAPVGIYFNDAQGKAVYINNKCAELVGVPADNALNFDWIPFLHPDDRDRMVSEWENAFKNSTEFHCEYRWVHQDGRIVWTLGEVIPILGEDGKAAMFIGTLTDITERKQAEKERESLIVQLQDRTAEQERFIYTVSHDLKSPLVNISCFADLAELDLNSGDQVSAKNDLAIIKQSALRMRRLLDELLEISRIGIKKNQEEVVNLNTLIEEGIFNLSGLIKEFHTTIEVESDLPDVRLDKQRFIQVIENLISNACRYSRSANGGSIVKIGVVRNTEKLTCYVKDNGVGLEADYLEKVFGLFEKLDSTSDSTGVGLAIVKRIIENHGGRIWAESEGLGQGTTFFFTLPVEKQ